MTSHDSRGEEWLQEVLDDLIATLPKYHAGNDGSGAMRALTKLRVYILPQHEPSCSATASTQSVLSPETPDQCSAGASEARHEAVQSSDGAAAPAAVAVAAREEQIESEGQALTWADTDSESSEDEGSDEEELQEEGMYGELRMPRVLLTPARQLPYPPTLEASNRILRQCDFRLAGPLPPRCCLASHQGTAVLRMGEGRAPARRSLRRGAAAEERSKRRVDARQACRYKPFEDRFLRAIFSDETQQPLFHTELSPAIMNWVQSVICNGVHLVAGHFVFLAFSSSQLREHGCWLYRNPLPGETQNGMVRLPSWQLQLGAAVARCTPRCR